MQAMKSFGLCILLLALSGCYSNGTRVIADLKCGKMGKNVLEIPERFVFAWEQQRDIFLLGKLDSKEERRCDEDIVALTIAMTWPGKELVDNMSYKIGKPEFDVVELKLVPWKKASNDLGVRMKEFIEAAKNKSEKPVSYVSALDMFFVENIDKNNPLIQSAYYWQERQGEISAVFVCLWSVEFKTFYMCGGTFAVVEAGALVGLQFSADKLWEWERIRGATKELVLSKAK